MKIVWRGVVMAGAHRSCCLGVWDYTVLESILSSQTVGSLWSIFVHILLSTIPIIISSINNWVIMMEGRIIKHFILWVSTTTELVFWEHFTAPLVIIELTIDSHQGKCRGIWELLILIHGLLLRDGNMMSLKIIIRWAIFYLLNLHLFKRLLVLS